MYLKNIEVQGFKSFANKIVFDFHNGITGIVGPNGSGKSNVADAVRWVLGEQRVKQLRGGTMQDVIFSGTENRKPLSYASVAITLDNSDHQLAIDYNEVTVTRKLYRSGESEYLINGNICRLKDVNELFYDTGIGKEGYSIIGQGQIDKILSGKPEERRELFDEAAGIVKFKRRKNMSLRKLEEEKQNLVRVTDILSELEKQIGPLEKQSGIAKEYLKKKEELKTYDINMFLLESARIREQMKDLEGKLANAKEELEVSGIRYEETKTEYGKIEHELEVVDDSLERAKGQLNETHLLRQQLEGQIELLKEQINSAKMSDEHFAQRSQAIREAVKEREEQRLTYEKEKEHLKAEFDAGKQRSDEAQDALVSLQLHIASMAAEIEKWKSDIMELLNRRASTKAQIQHFDTMLEQMQVRRSEMSKKLIEAGSDASIQDEKIVAKVEELEHVSKEIIGYTDEIKELESKIQSLQTELSGKTEQLRAGQTAYHREASRLESLRNITERYDGYGNSIRKVMERKEQEPGLLGVVADIIKVDKSYEIAIETALGGSIQNIVTDNEGTAKRMITYLKQNKFGRATFLPLTSMTGSQGIRQKEALHESGVIGLAHTLVTVEDKFLGLAENLLGRTIVVKHIDDGIALARKYKQSLRIVTMEGELINPGGSMTGGAFKNSSNLLSRRREIEEFEKTVLMLKNEMAQMELEVNQAKEERTSYYRRIDELNPKLQELYVTQNTIKIGLNQARAKKKEAVDVIASLHKERDTYTSQFSDIEEEKELIHTELELSEKLEKELTEKIEKRHAELEEEKKLENDAMQKAETQRLSLANYEQKHNFVRENIERVNEEIEKYKDELQELAKNKENSFVEIETRQNRIEEIAETVEHSKEVFAEIEEKIKSLTAEKEELVEKNKGFLNQREEISKHMSELDKECFRLNSKKEGCEEALEKSVNYMWEEYEITYSLANEMRDDSLTDPVMIRKQIQSLKGQIKALGSVNVNAIEDYRNVSERYEFLKTQHSDLVEAEATLVGIIEELDAAMRKQFAERFKEIAEEFDKVFKQLFGGGKGTLELMEEEDILEAGIRIIAQPPGKKLQNMMQLSGGEKALTAISLLFAIQNLKPSPFCLLDEIEAALDDSNVGRFAQYLHKLTKNTQFIVITHRRGTMNAADRLYGITMQEKGVSTLVSVDLLEKDLTK